MACMLYIRYYGKDIRVGRFKNREAAEEYYNLYVDTLKSPANPYPEAIYVETGIRKRKKALE